MTGTERQKLALLITQKLADLAAEDALGQEGQAVVTLDQQAVGRLSRMDALQSQAMSQATQARRSAQKSRLLAARQRLNDADFGECQECGELIAPKRLEFDPAVTLCIGCASN